MAPYNCYLLPFLALLLSMLAVLPQSASAASISPNTHWLDSRASYGANSRAAAAAASTNPNPNSNSNASYKSKSKSKSASPSSTASKSHSPSSTPPKSYSASSKSYSASSKSYSNAATGKSNNYTDATRFKNSMLGQHNSLRGQHRAPALVWDEKLAENAKAVAGKCVYAHSGGKYGENIAAGQESPEEVCSAWGVDERGDYDFSAGNFNDHTGHFTQMVWKSTTKLGCAAAQCNGILNYGVQWFTVCEYEPAGNVVGKFRDNVLPAGGSY